MTPEIAIGLCGLCVTIFGALGTLIWRMAIQHAKQEHLQDSYVAIHSRLDGFRGDIQMLREAMIGGGIDLMPQPSRRSQIPLPRKDERTP